MKPTTETDLIGSLLGLASLCGCKHREACLAKRAVFLSYTSASQSLPSRAHGQTNKPTKFSSTLRTRSGTSLGKAIKCQVNKLNMLSGVEIISSLFSFSLSYLLPYQHSAYGAMQLMHIKTIVVLVLKLPLQQLNKQKKIWNRDGWMNPYNYKLSTPLILTIVYDRLFSFRPYLFSPQTMEIKEEWRGLRRILAYTGSPRFLPICLVLEQTKHGLKV